MIDKTKKLFIFGTGQFSKIISQYFERYTNYKIAGYIDSMKQKNCYSDMDVLVLSEEEFLENYSPDNYCMFIAVGYTNMNKNRSDIFKKYKNFGFSFANFVHPNVVWWDNSKLGENSFIFENNVVQQNVSIGDNVIVWSGNHIGHDTEVQDNVWITSHVVIYSNVLISKPSILPS